MAAIVKLPSGSWRAQVRRKGKYATATFLRRKDADEWSLAIERNIDRGVLPNSRDPKSVRTLASIIDLHIRDHKEVGKPIRRSKSNVLEALRISLGDTRIHDLKRSKLIEYGKRRAKEGATENALVRVLPCIWSCANPEPNCSWTKLAKDRSFGYEQILFANDQRLTIAQTSQGIAD